MTWTQLHAQLHILLRQRKLLPQGQRLLVAVSGGQDSLCLLKLLLDLQLKWEWQIAIAHCDHCWSSDTGIADRVRQVAQQWQIPCYLKTATHLKETEAAARVWRYQALVEIAQEQDYKIIVTGHTQSDRVETLLYNLIRGAGADGLQALVWKRQLTPTIELVRPLLEITRTQTLQFCQQFQLPIWEDAANQNLKYARNRIRTQLLPYLQTHFNPQVETVLAQTAELLKADVEELEATAEQLLQQALQLNPYRLNRACLKSASLALQRRVMRKFLQRVFKQSPNFEQIRALINLIDAPNRTRTSSLPEGKIAEVQGDWILIFHHS